MKEENETYAVSNESTLQADGGTRNSAFLQLFCNDVESLFVFVCVCYDVCVWVCVCVMMIVLHTVCPSFQHFGHTWLFLHAEAEWPTVGGMRNEGDSL